LPAQTLYPISEIVGHGANRTRAAHTPIPP
jgi:hypothetical protein